MFFLDKNSNGAEITAGSDSRPTMRGYCQSHYF